MATKDMDNRVATKGQFTSSIAHEVNQPITAVVTNARAALRWIAAEPPEMEETRLALERIVRDGHRAAEVIGRIREQIKKAPARKDVLDINETIQEVIGLARSEAHKSGVSVEMQLAEDLPPTRGDRVQLQQVLLNLTINAIEAMSGIREGARLLRISTAQDGADTLRVEVRDSGPGLSPEALERVFDPFFTTKPTGMGLGLSICRSIVEAHGGALRVAANVPRGAVFQFTVSRERQEE